jgi:hypothetical protein
LDVGDRKSRLPFFLKTSLFNGLGSLGCPPTDWSTDQRIAARQGSCRGTSFCLPQLAGASNVA